MVLAQFYKGRLGDFLQYIYVLCRNYIFTMLYVVHAGSGIYQRFSRVKYEYRNSSLYLCQSV